MQHYHATRLFKDMAKGLKVLILRMVSHGHDLTVSNRNLFVLEKWIEEVEHAPIYAEVCAKDKLEVLSLSGTLPSQRLMSDPHYELTAIIKNIKEWIRPNLTKLHLGGFTIDFENLECLLCINLPKLRNLSLHFILLTNGIWDDLVEVLRQVVHLETCTFTAPLIYPDFSAYRVTHDQRSRDPEHYQEFLNANERYVLEGGEHPRSPGYEPSKGLQEWIAFLKGSRNEIGRKQ
ncbi:MAG: hypothetical protein Q9226_004597 [Calogaya cf. arnoldii]